MSQLQDKVQELKDSGVSSVESFVDYLLESDETDCIPGDVQALSVLLGKPFGEVKASVVAKGVKVRLNNRVPECRGFTSNSHDRFTAKNGFVGGCGIGPASRQMISPFQPR